MKQFEKQIEQYKKIQQKDMRVEAEARTIQKCQMILAQAIAEETRVRASYFEFLFEQSKFIRKRWWILQGGILLYVWYWLSNYVLDLKDMMRILGIFASVFVVLIVPEIWKNQRNGAVEIEEASYYTLRQICAARMLLFGVVDFAIIMIFLIATYMTTGFAIQDIVVNFILPVNVSSCICFRTLYSKWEKSEYLAMLLCLVWIGVWMMIVSNDFLYKKIAMPVWGMMILLTFAYCAFCVKRSLQFYEKMFERCADEVRI